MKVFKWIAIVLVAFLLLFFFIGMPYLREQTKKHSPEQNVHYTKNGFDLSVNYSSPFKKNRVIFGQLVPYDQVWRTGANEPTTFETRSDISIAGNALEAGKYSLWTRPGTDSWDIILNEDIPDWGVTLSSGGRETTREAEYDVLEISVPSEDLSKSVESFTIDFQEGDQLYLRIYWDKTQVKVPLSK